MLKKFGPLLPILFVVYASAVNAALLTTTVAGDLVFEVLSGDGASSTQEFGIGSPTLATPLADRNVVFVIVLPGVGNVAPSNPRNMGYFAAGSELNFYNISDFSGLQIALSSNLGGSPSASDLAVFRDTNNSLGFGGSIVETLGPNDWILHMDDAASYAYDDDDNEMVISVRVVPVPEPASIALLAAGAICVYRARGSRHRKFAGIARA